MVCNRHCRGVWVCLSPAMRGVLVRLRFCALRVHHSVALAAPCCPRCVSFLKYCLYCVVS